MSSPYSTALEEMGISISYGHRSENVSGADFVIASSAVSDTNIELEAAVEQVYLFTAGMRFYRRCCGSTGWWGLPEHMEKRPQLPDCILA